MKLDGTRLKNDVTLFMFTMNREEIRVMLDLIDDALVSLPKLNELIQTKGRLRNMKKVLFTSYKQK